MRSSIPFLAAAAGVAAGALLASPGARAQHRPGLAEGAGHAGSEKRTFAYSTVGGADAKVTTERQVIRVPADYGEAFAVTPLSERRVAVWYRAPDGTVQNVVIHGDGLAVRLDPTQ